MEWPKKMTRNGGTKEMRPDVVTIAGGSKSKTPGKPKKTAKKPAKGK